MMSGGDFVSRWDPFPIDLQSHTRDNYWEKQRRIRVSGEKDDPLAVGQGRGARNTLRNTSHNRIVAPALWGAPHYVYVNVCVWATAISADLFNLSLVAQWALSVAPSAAGRHQILIKFT